LIKSFLVFNANEESKKFLDTIFHTKGLRHGSQNSYVLDVWCKRYRDIYILQCDSGISIWYKCSKFSLTIAIHCIQGRIFSIHLSWVHYHFFVKQSKKKIFLLLCFLIRKKFWEIKRGTLSDIYRHISRKSFENCLPKCIRTFFYLAHLFLSKGCKICITWQKVSPNPINFLLVTICRIYFNQRKIIQKGF